MNDLIQSILTGIFVIGAILWVVYRLIRPSTKITKECKDCPLVKDCNKKCSHHSDCGCN